MTTVAKQLLLPTALSTIAVLKQNRNSHMISARKQSTITFVDVAIVSLFVENVLEECHCIRTAAATNESTTLRIMKAFHPTMM